MTNREDRCRFATRESDGNIYCCPLPELHDRDHIMIRADFEPEISVQTILVVTTALPIGNIPLRLLSEADLVINTEVPAIVKNRALPPTIEIREK